MNIKNYDSIKKDTNNSKYKFEYSDDIDLQIFSSAPKKKCLPWHCKSRSNFIRDNK